MAEPVLIGKYAPWISKSNHNGVQMYDIDPFMADPTASREGCEKLAAWVDQYKPDTVLGMASRGYLIAPLIGQALKIGVKLARAAGTTAGQVVSTTYRREYGPEKVMELGVNILKKGERVLIVDDVLATGGTIEAIINLIRQVGAIPVACCFIVQVDDIIDEKKMCGLPYCSLVHSVKPYFQGSKSITVALSSKSRVKKDAVLSAISKTNPDTSCILLTFNCNSGINPQPYGFEESTSGVFNRETECESLTRTMGIDATIVSIENGVVQKGDGYEDIAFICINGVAFTSKGVKFPSKYFEASRDTNFQKTVGQFIAEDNPGFDNSDWHVHFGGKSRVELIEDVIVERKLFL